MSDHISGQQARQLLEGATPGPWRWEDRDYPEYEEGYEVLWNGAETALRSQDSEQYSSWVRGSDNDKALVAAAPALADTVAWLYGYTSEVEPIDGTFFDRDGQDGTLADEHHYLRVDGDSEGVLVTTGPYGASVELTPDEAVDLARALLAAAETARKETP